MPAGSGARRRSSRRVSKHEIPLGQDGDAEGHRRGLPLPRVRALGLCHRSDPLRGRRPADAVAASHLQHRRLSERSRAYYERVSTARSPWSPGRRRSGAWAAPSRCSWPKTGPTWSVADKLRRAREHLAGRRGLERPRRRGGRDRGPGQEGSGPHRRRERERRRGRHGRKDSGRSSARSTSWCTAWGSAARCRCPIVELDEATWRMLLDINLTGAFLVAKAVAKTMIPAGEGKKIVLVSSMAGVTAVSRRRRLLRLQARGARSDEDPGAGVGPLQDQRQRHQPGSVRDQLPRRQPRSSRPKTGA